MKRLLSVLFAIVMMFTVTACGETEVEFDAQKYVQAVLDAKYKHDYSEYANQIGLSEEEAKGQLVSEFEASLEEQLQATGMTYTEEQAASYIQMEADLREKVQYEVKEAVKDEEGNYTVEVAVTPVDGYTQYQQNFMTDLQNAVNEGATEADYMRVFLECLQSSIDNAVSLTSTTMTFHITFVEQDHMRIYSISEDEVMEFDLRATGQVQ